MHLNHSCGPNLGLQGQVVYVALRDIRAGEELTADYVMTDAESYEMTCHSHVYAERRQRART